MHRGIQRDMDLLRQYSQKPDASRLDVARRVAVIVAWYMHDYEAVERVMTARMTAQECEQYVRDNADAAEAVTLPENYVIAITLAEEFVFDDYLRIKKREQHMAFTGEEGRDA